VTGVPLVTVLIPARNEAADIERCLAAVVAQDHPLDHLEVIVVDGASDDGTAEVVRRALAPVGLAAMRVVTNPAGTTPTSLNAGLAEAQGEIICRVDARTLIEPHHVRTCAATLRARPEVAVVGGSQVAIPRDRSPLAIGIARALNNRWSMGGSPYRRATQSGLSDTVFLGAFRRADLEAVGGWDERLGTNQDFDLNRRLGARGMVWFDHSIPAGYLPRPDLGRLWSQYRRFGVAKVRYWRLTGDRPQRRQWLVIAGLPVAAVAAVAGVRAAPPLAIGLVAGALAVEHAGTKGPDGGPAARGAAVVAMSVTSVGWWSGVVQTGLGLLRRG
jgi:succinoglycan biosynthesis protein ExoA